jgi:hypothetical protein
VAIGGPVRRSATAALAVGLGDCGHCRGPRSRRSLDRSPRRSGTSHGGTSHGGAGHWGGRRSPGLAPTAAARRRRDGLRSGRDPVVQVGQRATLSDGLHLIRKPRWSAVVAARSGAIIPRGLDQAVCAGIGAAAPPGVSQRRPGPAGLAACQRPCLCWLGQGLLGRGLLYQALLPRGSRRRARLRRGRPWRRKGLWLCRVCRRLRGQRRPRPAGDGATWLGPARLRTGRLRQLPLGRSLLGRSLLGRGHGRFGGPVRSTVTPGKPEPPMFRRNIGAVACRRAGSIRTSAPRRRSLPGLGRAARSAARRGGPPRLTGLPGACRRPGRSSRGIAPPGIVLRRSGRTEVANPVVVRVVLRFDRFGLPAPAPAAAA